MEQQTIDFIRLHRESDVRKLALQASRFPDVDMTVALGQIAGWQIARTKLPMWAATERVVYPPHLAMEQCSGEQAARYKAEVIASADSLVDLTGGFGVDFVMMVQSLSGRHAAEGSSSAFSATYVERQAGLCDIARHNFPLLGLRQAAVTCCDGEAFLRQMEPVSVIFLDPARRNEHGGKTVFLEDCTPNVLMLKEELLRKADRVLVKLSPMLDWHKAVSDLGCVREVHIVSVGNECKELLLLLSRAVAENRREGVDAALPKVVCVNLPVSGGKEGREVFVVDGQVVAKPAPPVASCESGAYLYEPNASVMKAGCFDEVARFYEFSPVSHNSHLFVSSRWVADFPGRKFRISAVSSMNKKDVRQLLRGVERANIAVRNFPMTAAELRKRLKLKDGGGIYLFATTADDGSYRLFLTTKALSSSDKA